MVSIIPNPENYSSGFLAAFWETFSRQYSCQSEQLIPLLTKYEKTDQIGQVILEIGCGRYPVTDCLNSYHVRILMDVLDLGLVLPSTSAYKVEVDLNCIAASVDPKYAEQWYGKKWEQDLAKYEKVLKNVHHIDTIVAGSVLNYIPWRNFFLRVGHDLSKNGLVFIHNGIEEGEPRRFHETRPRTREEILDFFNYYYQILERIEYSNQTLSGPIDYIDLVLRKKF